MIKFEKISEKQFLNDWASCGYSFGEDKYKEIKLPKRATKGSAGYDFYSLVTFDLKPGETIKIPTGIRCQMEKDMVLQMFIRSSIGFKYDTILSNSTGIIDSDYYYSDNEGHIWVKLRNLGKKVLEVNAGDAICQGILTKYFITDDDDTTKERNGGIGSTNK